MNLKAVATSQHRSSYTTFGHMLTPRPRSCQPDCWMCSVIRYGLVSLSMWPVAMMMSGTFQMSVFPNWRHRTQNSTGPKSAMRPLSIFRSISASQMPKVAGFICPRFCVTISASFPCVGQTQCASLARIVCILICLHPNSLRWLMSFWLCVKSGILEELLALEDECSATPPQPHLPHEPAPKPALPHGW